MTALLFIIAFVLKSTGVEPNFISHFTALVNCLIFDAIAISLHRK